MSNCSEKKSRDWINNKWRPAMGWMYMTICIFDFILFPILWAAIQVWSKGSVEVFRQWDPLTLQGAGLFHMAMGAVLGVAAWSRGQEKIANISNYSNESEPRYRHSRPDIEPDPEL